MISARNCFNNDNAGSAETDKTVYHQLLTPARIAEIRNRLVDELADVRRGLAEVWTSKALTAHEGRYQLSVDHVSAGRFASQLYDQLQERRTEILETLDRMRNGAFGNCTSCGNDIQYSRLEVSPEAMSCCGCDR
jgi:DnaK suppressor protein